MSGDIHRAPGQDGDIVPSSGFVDSVMQAIQREALEPEPIPFPWKRAAAGFLAASGILTAFIALAFFDATQAGSGSSDPATAVTAVMLFSLFAWPIIALVRAVAAL